MGKGKSKSSKSGGADESILRRDREQRDRNAQKDRAEKIDEDELNDDKYISFLSKSNANTEDSGAESEDHAFDLAAGGSSSDEAGHEDEDSSSTSDAEDSTNVSLPPRTCR
jgi:hypothetical protein